MPLSPVRHNGAPFRTWVVFFAIFSLEENSNSHELVILTKMLFAVSVNSGCFSLVKSSKTPPAQTKIPHVFEKGCVGRASAMFWFGLLGRASKFKNFFRMEARNEITFVFT